MKRYIRSGHVGGRLFWFLFDAGAVRGIIGSPEVLWDIAARHANEPLPTDFYGWGRLPDDVHRGPR